MKLLCRLAPLMVIGLSLPGPAFSESEAPRPLPLEEAVAIALKQNPAISAAANASEAAGAGVIQAKSGRWFSLDADMLGQRTFRISPLAGQLGFALQDTLSTVVTFTQPLSTGGKVEALVAQARAGRDASLSSLRLARQQVAFQTRQAYYAALLAAEAAQVAEEAKKSADEHLRIARVRFEAGAAPQFDVLQAEAFVARSEQTLIRAKNAAEASQIALNTAMGVPAGERFQLISPGLRQAPAEPLESLLSEAEKERPDLDQLRRQAQAARASISAAKADRKPSLSFIATYTGLSPESSFSVSGYDAFLAAHLNLMNGNRAEAGIAQAVSYHKAALDSVERLRQSVVLDVRSAHLDIAAARAALEAADKEVTQATEAHRVAVVRYNEGMGTSVEILDAEAQLSGARNRRSQARFEYNLALAHLDLAVGRDPQTDRPNSRS